MFLWIRLIAVEKFLASDALVVASGLPDDLVAFHEAEAFLVLRTRYPAFEIAQSILSVKGRLDADLLDLILAVFARHGHQALHYTNGHLVAVGDHSVRPSAGAAADTRAAFSPIGGGLLEAAAPAVGP